MIEAFSVTRASGVILNTSRMRDEFRSYYARLPAERFQAINNGYDPDLAVQVESLRQQIVPATAEPRTFVLCHPGHVYGHRDLRPLVRAVAELRAGGLDVRIEQIGEVVHESQRRELMSDPGTAEFFTILPRVPHAELMRRMAAVDVLVILQPGTDIQIPSKLFEMLLMKKPILALADSGETADIVNNYSLGCVADPRDATAIADCLRRLLNSSQPWPARSGWEEATRSFDGRVLTSQLADFFNRTTVSVFSPLARA
jgi:glycosyltransferase involved in cell wall biosynthesis